MKTKNKLIILALSLVMVLGLIAGCNQPSGLNRMEETVTEADVKAEAGVIHLKVNPEIAITYSEDGTVLKVSADNRDGREIIRDYSDYEGKAARTVISELVERIGDAGYFVEEIEGERRTIVLELEAGSMLPHDDFVDGITLDIEELIKHSEWTTPVVLRDDSDYDDTNYDDTNYDDTNYDDTNYDDTNYDDTDYDDDSDYQGTSRIPAQTTTRQTTPPTAAPTTQATAAPTAPPTAAPTQTYDDTDYDDTDYDDTDYDNTDYDDTNYDDTDYDDSDYDD